MSKTVKRGVVVIEENYISAAIVTYNDGNKASDTVDAILNNTLRRPLGLYVFDNNSTDDTARILEKKQGIIFKRQKENSGFGGAHNKILGEKMGKYHFVINPDIKINNDVLSDIADFMDKNPDIVMLMPEIYNEDGSIQYLPKKKPTFKRLFIGRFSDKIRKEYTMENEDLSGVTDIDFVTGCFFCIRSDVFRKIGGFDERFFMYMEDVDLTLSAQKYGRTVLAPQFCVTHLWARESSKNIKYLLIHINSAFKFFFKKR